MTRSTLWVRLRGVYFLVVSVLVLRSLMVAQTTPQRRGAAAKATATIVKYEVLNNGKGPLRVSYSDGAIVDIPRERGAYQINDKVLEQQSFGKIRIADDRRQIGWVADYMMCAQSYPCDLVVTIFQAGRELRYASGDSGVIWDWTFLGGGSRFVVHCGFPHGDDKGYFLLFKSDGGAPLERYIPGDGRIPQWVTPLLSSDRNR